MTDICASIFMLTYNQEDFIAQAIEGVLMQETNFGYELVIGEDFSADKTRAICEQYAEANPKKIKLLPSYKNLGLIQNFIRTYKECNGKYVAICDGDDYWTDPLKLQKQVDFLDGNLDYNIVFTSFKFLFTDGRFAVKDYEAQRESTGFEDLIFQNYICSATALFRNKRTNDDFPGWLFQCPYGDWPLYLWATRKGEKIKYLNDFTAVYRREVGVSEKMKLVPSRIASENLKIIEKVKKDNHFQNFHKKIKKSVVDHRKNLLACYIREAKLLKTLKSSAQMIKENPGAILKLYSYMLKRKMYPLFVSFKRKSRRAANSFFYRSESYNKMVFKRIYKKDLFNKVPIKDKSISRSGPGSSLTQTKELISRLPILFKKYKIKTVLDLPCGDFHWMKNIDFTGINYLGGDIVPEIIHNNSAHVTNVVQFKVIDILNDDLPKVDLIICRDLFVHLKYEQISLALNNIKDSESKFLLVTSYKNRLSNRDIKEIGQWRTLNMEIEPFKMNNPIDEIFENCSEGDMQFNDKFLLLYKVSQL